MKYIVMECCDAYAVLMDEQSVFVKAANLHYSVGQTVTSPILMNDSEKPDRSRIKIISKIAASAASLVILFGFGYNYYSNNYKAYATIYISAGSEYEVVLNKKNEVLSVASNDKNGGNIIKNYSVKGKDKETVSVELIMLEKENGLLTDGESVEIYVESGDKESAEKFSADIEKKISELNLNISVTDNKNNDKESYPLTDAVPDTDAVVPPADVHAEPSKPAVPNKEHKPEVPDIPDNHPNIAHPEMNHDKIDSPVHPIPDEIVPIPETNGEDAFKPKENENEDKRSESVHPPHDEIISPNESEYRNDIIKPADAEHGNEPSPVIHDKNKEKHNEKLPE